MSVYVNTNAVKDDIYYHIKNGELSFFYREFLLFKHTKNNPAISVLIFKGEAEKEIPLVNFDIIKRNIDQYEMDFYHQLYKVNVLLRLEKNVLDVVVNSRGEYGAVKLSLKNSVGKIKGFGFTAEEWKNGGEIASDGWYGPNKKSFSNDRIPAFLKEKKYFLAAYGTFEWKIRISDYMDMFFKGTRTFSIKTAFLKSIEEIRPQKSALCRRALIETTAFEQQRIPLFLDGRKTAAILTDGHIDFWDLVNIRERYKKENIEVLRKIYPKISVQDDYFREFTAEDFILSKNGKPLTERGKEDFLYFDLTKSEACRKAANYIRRILGSNIDGLYSAERENAIYNREEYAPFLHEISERWQELVYRVSQEYFSPKILIFDTLSHSTGLYGTYAIAANRKVVRKLKRYTENLENSGIFYTAPAISQRKEFRMPIGKKKKFNNSCVIYKQ